MSVTAAVPAPATTDPCPGGLGEDEARRADLLWAGGLTLLIALLFALIKLLSAAAVPILVALALSYALHPTAGWLERRGLPRTLAVLILFAVIGLAITGALLYLVPAIGQ